MNRSDSAPKDAESSQERSSQSGSIKRRWNRFYEVFLGFSALVGIIGPNTETKVIGGVVTLIGLFFLDRFKPRLKAILKKFNIVIINRGVLNSLEDELFEKNAQIDEFIENEEKLIADHQLDSQKLPQIRNKMIQEGMDRVIGEKYSVRASNLSLIGWSRNDETMILFAKRKNKTYKHEIGARYLIKNANGESKGVLQVIDNSSTRGKKYDVTLECITQFEYEYWNELERTYHSHPQPNPGDYLDKYLAEQSPWYENEIFSDSPQEEKSKS